LTYNFAHDTSPFIGDFSVFGADIIDKMLGIAAGTVRQWRNRGYFLGGEKMGRGYVYDIEDIAKLMILNEMSDIGLKMVCAAGAAETGATELVAHVLLKAPLIDLWVNPKQDLKSVADTIRIHNVLPLMFDEPDMDFADPHKYLVTSGDDINDWVLIDKLSEIENLEDFNLAVVFIDLSKLADRVINVLQSFHTGSGDPPAEGDLPPTVVNFWTKDCMNDGARIVRFSMDRESPLIETNGKPKPDLKVVPPTND
jgi:hypothetical protein